MKPVWLEAGQRGASLLNQTGQPLRLEQVCQAYLAIKASRTLLITSPLPPDTDSLASCSLTAAYLDRAWPDKSYMLYCPEDIIAPRFDSPLHFLPLEQFSILLPEKKPDCVVIADYGNFQTTGLKPDCGKFFIGFDHHDSPANDFPPNGIQIIDPSAPSATAVLWKFFRLLGIPLSPAMATYVALGIYADTERFTNHRSTQEAFEIFTQCLAHGVSWEEIRISFQKTRCLKRMQAMGTAFPEIVEHFDKKLRFTWMVVDGKRLQALGGFRKAMEVLEEMEQLRELDFCAMLIEEPHGAWRISLRSSFPEKISAAALGRNLTQQSKLRGGGGHAHAAVANWNKSPEEAISSIRKFLGALAN